MADSLRETLEAVVDQAEQHPDEPLPASIEPSHEEHVEAADAPAPSPAPAPAPTATPSVKEDVAAAQLAAAKKAPTEVKEPPAKPATGAAPTPTPAPSQHVTERAPASWTQEAKGEWEKVPLPVRQEILRRERQIDEALGQSTEARNLMNTMNQIVQPYMARLNQNKVHPIQSIKNLLEADHLLATAPQPARAAFLAKIIKDYDISIEQLDQALAGQISGKAAPVDGINDAVQRAIAPLMAPIQEWQRQQAQAVLRDQQNAITAVQKMELDPKYEFFQDVRDYMADVVEMYAKRGLAITAEDAYNVAIQTHPEISKIVYERNNQEAARAALNRGTEAAQKARSAAVSVGSSVPAGGNAQPNGGMSLRDTIEAAFTVAGNGGRI